MNTAEVLRLARNLIVDPDHWTQDCVARTADGQVIEIDHEDDGVEAAQSEEAVRWCAGGAIMRVAGPDYCAAQKLLERAIGLSNHPSIGPWNDIHTHNDVLAAFEKAIAEARALEDK